jgi:hypothetical protein
LAFKELLQRQDKVDVFERMANWGTASGKLYGICGLRLSAPTRLRAHLVDLKHSTEVLNFADGCEPAHLPMRELTEMNVNSFCDSLGVIAPPVATLGGPQAALDAHHSIKPGAPGEVLLKFERGSCFGPCPVYAVEVAEDGSVRFEGRRFVLTTGSASGHLDDDAMIRLRELVARLVNLREPAANDCRDYSTDAPTVTITVRAAKGAKHIRDYHGCGCMKDPKKEEKLRELRQIEGIVDTVVGVERWIGTLAQRKKCCYGPYFR